ncbi:hypothetical protein [Rosenbergiella epipactidis]|uniref:hypothetical protein n=1 Tax=Rosenbergiella epipactidis TaxID=1544694 RepID=UPI001F4EC5CF|nr:hypothetical protein [Rosenbergiella epipactidis]
MSKSTYDPLPPFHLFSAIDEALDDIEYERQQSGDELLKEKDKHSLTLLAFGIDKLIQVEAHLRQEQEENNLQKRYFSGTSPDHPSYASYDASDFVRTDIITALNALELFRTASLLQEIFRKESIVTRGEVLNNVKQSQKRTARKGADVSRTHKQNLLEIIESLSHAYCTGYAKRYPSRTITITMIANAINAEVIQYMLSSPTLIGVYKITEEEQQYPDRCSRIDSLRKNISLLKKAGKLAPWLPPKK